jgi:predicted ATPase
VALRGAIEWSYNPLSEPEQKLLRRPAVFAEGWMMQAAEAICVGGGVEPDQVADLVTPLVDKTLVLAETRDGEAGCGCWKKGAPSTPATS